MKWNEDFLRKLLGYNWQDYLPPENKLPPPHYSFDDNYEIEDMEVLFEPINYEQLIEEYVELAMEIKDRDEMRELFHMLVEEVYSAVEDEILMDDISDKINYSATARKPLSLDMGMNGGEC